MSGSAELEAAASGYGDAVATLLRARPAAGDRGAAAPRSPEDLADQAEALLPLSDALTEAAVGDLQAQDPEVRDETGRRLLAKATIDLEVAVRLLAAVEDEDDDDGGPGPPEASDRAIRPVGTGVEDELKVLLGGGGAQERSDRGERPPRDLGEARARLASAVTDTLTDVTDTAVSAGTKSLSGLVGLGLGELAEAAGIVGSNLADALGVGAELKRLVRLARDLVTKAYESIVALLGAQLAQQGASRLVEWIKEKVSLENVLSPLYQTEATEAALHARGAESSAELDAFAAAIAEVRALDDRYGQHIALARKLTTVLNKVGAIVARLVPHGILLVAATQLTVTSYVVLVGADYVDAPRLQRLDRVPGVRRVVESHLG